MEEKVRNWVNELFDHPDFADCFLLDVDYKPPKKIIVYLDSDEGVTLRKCQRISRRLEEKLDQDPDLVDNYLLEVSSGGAERPLELVRQYPKHLGRTLIVELLDGTKLEGELLKVNEQSIQINQIIRERGKKNVNKAIEVAFDEINKSIIKIRFK